MENSFSIVLRILPAAQINVIIILQPHNTQSSLEDYDCILWHPYQNIIATNKLLRSKGKSRADETSGCVCMSACVSPSSACWLTVFVEVWCELCCWQPRQRRTFPQHIITGRTHEVVMLVRPWCQGLKLCMVPDPLKPRGVCWDRSVCFVECKFITWLPYEYFISLLFYNNKQWP